MEIRERQRSTTMKRTVNVLSKLNWGTRACAVLVLCATTAIALPAQTLTTLYSFDAQSPQAGLVQATNGDLYGTTSGFPNGYGTVFKITPGGRRVRWIGDAMLEPNRQIHEIVLANGCAFISV